jgi:uncharacterized membrane protein
MFGRGQNRIMQRSKLIGITGKVEVKVKVTLELQSQSHYSWEIWAWC